MYAETLLDIAMQHASSLIEKAIEGDISARSQLVKLWFKRIYNFSLKYLSDHDLAMEVAQKTFIVFYEKAEMIKDPARFKPWLYRVATNKCHEELRKQSTRSKYFSRDVEESANKKAEGVRFNPAEGLNHADRNTILQKALDSLAVDQREVLIMKEYEGLKFSEIAEILAVNENTVKSKLYYGLSHLRKYFEKNKISKEMLAI